MNAITAPPAIPTAADIHRERVRTDIGVASLLAIARAMESENIPHGSRGTIKRRKRVDPLIRLVFDGDKIRDQSMRHAAIRYRIAYEHMEAGRGLGPMPWGKDEVTRSAGDGPIPAQMRAVTAAACYRASVQALGLVASQGVVQWVVIAGLSLSDYDAKRAWAEGKGKLELVAALERLALAYGYPMPAVENACIVSGANGST